MKTQFCEESSFVGILDSVYRTAKSVNGGAWFIYGGVCFINGVSRSVNGGTYFVNVGAYSVNGDACSVNGGANFINIVAMFECRGTRLDNPVLKFQTDAPFSIKHKADILKFRHLFVLWGSHT